MKVPFPFSLKENRLFLRFIHFLEWGVTGHLRVPISTPGEVVWMWERSSLIEYELPRVEVRYRIPLLIVPPLMVKPWIFDLRPGHSMVGFFTRFGFKTYMLDYGIPDERYREIKVDDFVCDFIPNAIEKILTRTGASQVSLLGWSMGGIMGYTYIGLLREKSKVKNLVTIGSPLNFSRMYPFNLLAKVSYLPGVTFLMDWIGNIPPYLTKNAFKLMDPVKLITRKIQVFQNGWDRDWLSGYEAIRDWVEEFIPYPGAAFKQFVLDYIRDDKLRSGTLTMRGTPIDIKRIRVNLLVVVGMEDDVARPPSVEAGYEEIPSPDKKLLRVPLGHIGLVAGEKAPSMVWEPVARWLQERSEPIIKKERSS